MQIINPASFGDNSVTDAMVQALGRFKLFTASGTFTPTKTGDHLIIAVGGGGGGGGGGGVTSGHPIRGSNGGGGLQGSIVYSVQSLTSGTDITITIGAGGTAGGNSGQADGYPGGTGGDTVAGTVTAAGGTGGLQGVINAGTDLTSNAESGHGPGGGLGALGYNVNANGLPGGNATGNMGGGGGGGGGACNPTLNTGTTGGVGGTGAPGMVLIIW